ncbi:MAG: transposase [Armatimonadetes bacterium]|nr:transposase [Armatimonadota bacterium]
MDRTLRLSLSPTTEQAESLLETMRQFTHSFNAVCAQGWRLKEGNAYTLHKLTYRNCKSLCPELVSDLHVQARQKAAEAVKSALALARKGKKVSKPQSTLCPPRYNVNSFSVDWQKGVVNLATVAGRQKVAFSVPAYALALVGNRVSTADLVYRPAGRGTNRKGRFTLHVVLKLGDVEFADNGQCLGVDLGVTRPAVTSDGRLHGKKRWREVSKRRFRLKRKLQSNGSKSAKRHLRTLAGRETRFRRDCDHVLSKRILDGITVGTTVVVENLTNIRQRVKATRGEAKRRLHSWSFAQLRWFLDYKAEALGCRVVGVDPRHTSQRCATCGHIYRGNRPSQSRFVCRSCGHRANADINAARSIRDKYLVGWSSPSDAAPSEVASSQPLLA